MSVIIAMREQLGARVFGLIGHGFDPSKGHR